MRMMQHKKSYTPPMSKNVQGIISNNNMTLSIQKRTLCEHKCTGDDQQWEWHSVNTETHWLWANAQGMISNGNVTLSMQKHTICEHKCTGDDQQWEWHSVNAETHNLWAQMHRGWSAMGMTLCKCRNTQTVSSNMQETISHGNHIDAGTHFLWVEMHRVASAMRQGPWLRRTHLLQCFHWEAIT